LYHDLFPSYLIDHPFHPKDNRLAANAPPLLFKRDRPLNNTRDCPSYFKDNKRNAIALLLFNRDRAASSGGESPSIATGMGESRE
jgi:hypothetical protein